MKEVEIEKVVATVETEEVEKLVETKGTEVVEV